MATSNKASTSSAKEVKVVFNEGIQLPTAALNQILSMSHNTTKNTSTGAKPTSKKK